MSAEQLAAALCPRDVSAAAERIAHCIPRTQTRTSPKLAALTGARQVYLKIDTSLHTASFKERGAANALRLLSPDQAQAGVITASAGNHAQALAHHAKLLGISAMVVMPEPTPLVKVEGARALGAEIVLHGESFDDAHQHALALADDQGRTLVHGFDNPGVIAGQGVAMLELLADAPDIDITPIQVGGGGLMAGCLLAREGLRAEGKCVPDVLAVEPTLYPSMARALRGDPPIEQGGDTIAEGVAIKAVGPVPRAVIAARLSPEKTLSVAEAAIEEAVVHLAMTEKLVVEGAGALGLAAMLAHPEHFRDRTVGLFICGGNIDARLFGQVLARHTARCHRRARIRVECPDRPGRLAAAANIVQGNGANVMEVIHDRMALDALAKSTVIDFIIEIENPSVTSAVVARLQAAGFPRARIIETNEGFTG